MSVSHATGRARSGELAIHYRKLGRRGATPILIVHGLSYFSWDWLEVAQALAADREVACMDMRGFGDSDWSPQMDYSVPSMAQDIVSVAAHLGWKRAVLVGHSMGGRSATCAAAKHPALAAGLALVDFTPENAPAGSKRIASIVAGIPQSFGSIEEAMSYFGSKDRPRFEHYLRKVDHGYVVKRDPHFQDQFRRLLETGERPKLGVDLWALLGEVRCPILSMRGARSDMYAPETAAKMKAANSRLQVIEVDAGHNIAGDNPQGFVAAFRKWSEAL